MKLWLYKGADPADINEVYSVGPEIPAEYDEAGRQLTAAIKPVLHAFKVECTPGAEFEAPDDWQPFPYPHPLFEEIGIPSDASRGPTGQNSGEDPVNP